MNDDDSEVRRKRGREEFEKGCCNSKHCNHARMITKLGVSSRRNNRDKQEKADEARRYTPAPEGFPWGHCSPRCWRHGSVSCVGCLFKG